MPVRGMTVWGSGYRELLLTGIKKHQKKGCNIQGLLQKEPFTWVDVLHGDGRKINQGTSLFGWNQKRRLQKLHTVFDSPTCSPPDNSPGKGN